MMWLLFLETMTRSLFCLQVKSLSIFDAWYQNNAWRIDHLPLQQGTASPSRDLFRL